MNVEARKEKPMRHMLRVAVCLAVSLLIVAVVRAEERSIGEAELLDKTTGFWLGAADSFHAVRPGLEINAATF